MLSEAAPDVQPESSTGAPAADQSQATTQPEQQNGGPQSQSVPYERFAQVNQRMRAAEQRVQQYEARIAQLEQAREQTGKPVSDEERQLKEARDAFYDKVAPELKEVPQLLQGMAQERFVSSGERMIESFAKQHGLAATELSNSLADIIKNDPALMARAQKGDVSLVAQYLRGLAPVVASMKKQGADAQRLAASMVGQTKNALSKLPPRPTGTVPGGVAFTKPVAGDQASIRTARRERHDAMSRMVDEL